MKRPASNAHHRRRTAFIIAASLTVLIVTIIIWVYTESLGWREDTIRQENIAYCGTSDPQQMLDYYRPEKSDGQDLPVVVYIHGGGWRGGSKRNHMINNYGPIFIKQRIAVAAVNYRLNSAHPYPDQNNDIACALTYLTKNSVQLHIDTARIILFGESAGGELAAYAALNTGQAYARAAGVIDFYGVSDFTRIISGPHPDVNARRYLGSGYANVAEQASPLSHVSAEAPRFLLVHGANDKIVPSEQSKSLRDALVGDGASATYIELPNAGHSFVGPELPPSSYRMLMDSLDAFLQDTTDR